MNQSFNNNRGDLSLGGMLFTLFLLAFFLYTSVNILKAHKRVKDRTYAYLCFKYQLILLKKYVANIGKLNRVIRTSFYAKTSTTPEISQAAAIAHEMALQKQTETHLHYLDQHLNNNYCQTKDAIVFTNNQPYQQKELLLTRNTDGTTILRRTRWIIQYYQKKILLYAHFGLESPLSTMLSISTEEKTTTDLLNSKVSFGPVF